jgi:addiction module HigA family antidote
MARRNPDPGEILEEELLREGGLSQNRLARALGIPGNRTHAIVKAVRDITADTDLRLRRFFRLSKGYVLRLQNAHDTLEAKRRRAGRPQPVRRRRPGPGGRSAFPCPSPPARR